MDGAWSDYYHKPGIQSPEDVLNMQAAEGDEFTVFIGNGKHLPQVDGGDYRGYTPDFQVVGLDHDQLYSLSCLIPQRI